MSKDFDRLLKQVVERFYKRHPSIAPLKKLRVLVKSAARNSPGLLFSRFKEALAIEGVRTAIGRRDTSFFNEHDPELAPIVGLFALAQTMRKEELNEVWSVIDKLVDCTSTDDISPPEIDESGWSELVGETLGQHVSLPECLREKTSALLDLVIGFLDDQSTDELTSDMEDILEGVDLSAMLPEEQKETPIDGGLLKGLLPHLRSLKDATNDDALRVTRTFLRSESMKGVVRILRRMFRCVDSAMLVRLVSDAIEKIDVSSISNLISSSQALQDDPQLARGVALLTRTANVPALQSLLQDAAQLVDPSVIQKLLGTDRSRSGVSWSMLFGSTATPDLVSRLPSIINNEGGVDLAAVPGLMRGGRRMPRRPRLSASRLAN